MTQLFIDNQTVVLQKNFSIQLIEENPFFTRNGKTTLEVTLSLKNKTNAKIYKHCHRLNNSAPIALNRSARLIANNKVLLIGTEIILEISDTEVKIQLVAGESEMNFLTSERKINELDLGDILDSKIEYIPIFSTSLDDIINKMYIYQPVNNAVSPYLAEDLIVNVAYQPLLYHVINKIIKSFGYKEVSNVLETTDFKYLYFLNITNSSYYNKMLPDWTVSEFFEEIEKLFNVIFLVDEHSKRVDIRFKKDFYDSKRIIFIDKVLDNYTQKIDTENRTDYSVANIGYDVDSDDYFKFQNIDPEILKHVDETIHFPDFNSIVSHFNAIPNKESLKDKIFIADNSNTQYICYLGEKLETEDYYPKKVNAFEPIRNNPNSTDIDIELKIKPASMCVFDVPVYKEGTNSLSQPLYFLRTQMPIMESNPYDFINNYGSIDIQNIIEGESTIDQQKVSNMVIYFYKGKVTIYEPDMEYAVGTRKVDFPMAFVDFLYEFNVLFDRKINEDNLSLRLNYPEGFRTLYEQSISIDTTKEYKFIFITNKKLNARSLFVFNNKKFACKEFRFTIDEVGINSVIEGLFYPVE